MATGEGAKGGSPAQTKRDCAGQIFLSYTREEIDQAKRIIGLLEHAGYEVWWDGLLAGGETYLKTTEAALESADCVVVLWSETAVDSHWVRDEAQRGRERGCLVPLSLDGSMAPLGFRQVQLIDISAWDGQPETDLAQQVLQAVALQCNAKVAAPAAQLARPSMASPAALGTGVSRRAMVFGGVGVAGLLAAGGWYVSSNPLASGDTVSMAVLPFTNLTGDDRQGWFSVGLSNQLRTVLTRNPRLLVSAPTSSAMNRDRDDFAIGAALGVSHVLRGSVQLVADTVRISAELAQIDNGLVRWSESFDREFADILAVQSEIAESVALSLVTQIASEGETRKSLDEQNEIGGTENISAYEAYLRGLALFDLSSGLESDRAAQAQFEAAIETDPNYAAAHAMHANTSAAIANATSDASEIGQLYAQSIAAAEQAIALEPKLALGHLAMGFALNNGRLDRKSAYPHYRSAQELAPGDADTQRSVAIFYAYGDQQSLAIQMIDRVLELDPLNARAFRSAGYIALFARDFPLVIKRMERALELNPNLASAQFAIGNAHLLQQEYALAQEAFSAEPVALFSQVGTAITQRKLDNAARAEEAFAMMLDQYGDAAMYQQAQVLAQWGDLDASMDRLQKAFEQSDPGVLFAPNDPLLDPIRSRAGFADVIARLVL